MYRARGGRGPQRLGVVHHALTHVASKSTGVLGCIDLRRKRGQTSRNRAAVHRSHGSTHIFQGIHRVEGLHAIGHRVDLQIGQGALVDHAQEANARGLTVEREVVDRKRVAFEFGGTKVRHIRRACADVRG